ncbi:MAG: adenosylmethionine--8-amino-7-oxononanoate transaminase [Gammaproteobacteria bacterium]|nr:adenosylmethionine--8-amino-7-oxononanoate transaminase [Gammaproteobacteria bacterium]
MAQQPDGYYRELVEGDRRHLWHPFTQEKTAPDPVPIVSGRGIELTDAAGNTYLDMISSWWVNIHGHAHPHIAGAIARQAATLEQVIFAGFTHPPAVALATALARLLPGDLERVFFSDDGSTAVEVALKMALQFHLNQGRPRTRFLAFEGGYHGDTVGAMSAGRSSGFFGAFESMMFRVDTLPFPHTWQGDDEVERKEEAALAALDTYLERFGDDTAAMILEPLVQGAGGMRMCRPGFVHRLAARLREAGVLVIFDEIMTGFGRTGSLFACRACDVTPDMICLSKGLTGGFLPLAVTVAREPIYQGFYADDFDKALIHGHSYTANPIGCAAALASLELTESSDTAARLAAIAAWHGEFMAAARDWPGVARARVTGTIAALDVEVAGAGYRAAVGPCLKAFFMERGFLIRPLGNVVYLMPPYCVTREQLARAYEVIGEGIARCRGA